MTSDVDEISCEGLWTTDVLDPHVGSRLDEGSKVYYLNLNSPQYMQIFRTTIQTNFDELNDGSWIPKAETGLVHHFNAIDAHLNHSRGAIINEFGKQVVGEGSSERNKGMRPYRVMHGLVSFRNHKGFDETWRPGLLFLRSKMLYLMKPWAPMDNNTGGDMEYVRCVSWISEVALGFWADGRCYRPHTIGDAGVRWLEEAARWKGKDFP